MVVRRRARRGGVREEVINTVEELFSMEVVDFSRVYNHCEGPSAARQKEKCQRMYYSPVHVAHRALAARLSLTKVPFV